MAIGGYRPGSGRKPIAGTMKSLKLREALWLRAAIIGEGNASEGIRRLLHYAPVLQCDKCGAIRTVPYSNGNLCECDGILRQIDVD